MTGVDHGAKCDELVREAQGMITSSLESGRPYMRIEDICTVFSRKTDPWIRVHNATNQCIWLGCSHQLFTNEIIELKKDHISSASHKTITLTWGVEPSMGEIALSFASTYSPLGDYRLEDAVAEIVEMLEAACPKNRRYDPNYIDKLKIHI